jgi:hypothetical protein
MQNGGSILPGHSGPFTITEEISANTALRDGPGRPRTYNQAVMSALPYPKRSVIIGIFAGPV